MICSISVESPSQHKFVHLFKGRAKKRWRRKGVDKEESGVKMWEKNRKWALAAGKRGGGVLTLGADHQTTSQRAESSASPSEPSHTGMEAAEKLRWTMKTPNFLHLKFCKLRPDGENMRIRHSENHFAPDLTHIFNCSHPHTCLGG